ncbi:MULTISPECIES: hypothetical protein [Streptomyces]|uniref:Uncharacterized protein n=2 Tax=Streptomyces TaxID=1883 RepID=A0ABV9IHT3_9ACTN
MSARGEQAMRVLSRFGELAWFALPAEVNPTHGYIQLPYLGWRYTNPQEGLAQRIEAAVRALPTQVDWTLDTTRKNWVLVPDRVLAEAGGLADPSFRNVVNSLSALDQEFCRNALADLEIILEHLQYVRFEEQ